MTSSRKPSGLVLAAISVTLLAGCKQHFPIQETNAGAPKTSCVAPALPAARLSSSSGWPSAECVERAAALTSQMSARAKYGQMMLPDRGAVRPGDTASLALGTILSGGGSAPSRNTPLHWAQMVNEFREQSLKSASKIPVMYGIDAVHGHNNVHGAVIFPHNIGLGAARNPELMHRIGQVTAKEVAATNIDWTFAPVVAAARDERWGRTYEAFGETTELAELLAPPLIRGLQGDQLDETKASVLACAKHFVGDGHTLGGKDRGSAPLSADEVQQQLLPAYEKSIEAGVGSIMVSFSSVEDVPMHCHGPLINDTLKATMGFNGFVVSDWEAVELLPGTYEQQLAASINAGVDMVMAPKLYSGFIDAMQRLVPAQIPAERVDDAVARIVAVKCELGLLDSGTLSRDRSGALSVNSELLEQVGSEEHRAVAREAVQQSLVLLKNEQSALPLKANQRIALVGPAADDLGRQCGGWTISWQGQSGDLTEGTTLLEAFKERLPEVQYSADGSGLSAKDVDVVVVAVAEPPYAEYSGDNPELVFPDADLRAFQAARQLGVPTVLVMFSGRPMMLGELTEADALVAAFLPGTEGDGLTDVLFGDVDFKGRLSHSWPKRLDQIPINVGDADYDPLWPYDFGLSYQLSESSAVAPPPAGGPSDAPSKAVAPSEAGAPPQDPTATQPK